MPSTVAMIVSPHCSGALREVASCQSVNDHVLEGSPDTVR